MIICDLQMFKRTDNNTVISFFLFRQSDPMPKKCCWGTKERRRSAQRDVEYSDGRGQANQGRKLVHNNSVTNRSCLPFSN